MTAKQRYDAAMKAAGYVRVQGWASTENVPKIKAMMATKAGLDASTGEHLIKIGEKRAKKQK